MRTEGKKYKGEIPTYARIVLLTSSIRVEIEYFALILADSSDMTAQSGSCLGFRETLSQMLKK